MQMAWHPSVCFHVPEMKSNKINTKNKMNIVSRSYKANGLNDVHYFTSKFVLSRNCLPHHLHKCGALFECVNRCFLSVSVPANSFPHTSQRQLWSKGAGRRL